jgi:hypothetical protein
MCYTNRNWSREEEEARRLRAEDARRHHERDVRPVHRDDPKKKPLIEKAKEKISLS